MVKNAVRLAILVSVFAVGLAIRPPTASAAVYADGVSPVYLVVSVPENFDVTSVPSGELLGPVGSQTIVVQLGTFLGGQGLLDTRFATNRLSTIPLPVGLTFSDLDHNQVTIFGGVLVQGTSQVHMLCPSPDPINGAVQIAFYNASRDGVIDNLIAPIEGVPQFPTTYDIAAAVSAYLPTPPEGQSQLTVNEVEANLFATPNRLTLSNNGVLAVASEGELFPHDPGNKIFDFVIAFDQNANFDSELCYSVTIVVKPNSSTKP